MEKEKLRPLYLELQGYLSQAPSLSDKGALHIYDKFIWEQYNGTIELLQEISGKDYNRFIIFPQGASDRAKGISRIVYRQKLGGVINLLYGEYFSEEQAPFSEGPNTIINQNQQQNQSFHIQMLLDAQSKIDEKIPSYKEGTKERKFLQKLKNSLSSVSNVVQLLGKCISVAKELGIDMNALFSILQ